MPDMNVNRVMNPLRLLTICAFVFASLLSFSVPASAGPNDPSYIYGAAYDAVTAAPLANICVILGPVKINCFTRTAADGTYRIDFPPGDLVTAQQQLEFLDQSGAYLEYDSPNFQVKGATLQNAPMRKPGMPLPCGFGTSPTKTLYLPNITRTLGGADGWYTPYIVQNTGTLATRLEISSYRFSDGALVSCRAIDNLAPGTSFADNVNYDASLPGDSQFSVVVRSFGASVVAVVNEHQHQATANGAEAMSYDAVSSGALSVFLPNITRRFFGFDTPFIIQNLGAAQTTATARFVSFDGTAPTITSLRVIDPGRSQPIDPNFEPGLVDGKQYAVTVTASQPLAVVVNTQDDQFGAAAPKAYSDLGLATGAATLYGAYAPKNADGIGRSATIVVQNMGTTAASPTMAFTPFGGATATSFTLSAIQPGGSRVFDMRYANGDTTQAFCSSASVMGCLADGDYSFTANAAGASLAAVVNVISNTNAMGYAANPTPSTKSWSPNVTRTLGGATGWTTPIIVQSVTAASVTLKWYRFADGALIVTQVLTMTPGSAARVDPRTVSGLSDDTQYSVTADGGTGTINSIVVELANGADNAMIYEGFTAP
jgi:hypothetical protein